jgi:hypothetical protein
MDFLALLVAAAVLVGVLRSVAVARHRRARDLRAWAATRGWTCVPSGVDEVPKRWRGVPFGVARDPRTTDAVTGPFAGRPGCSFTYRYTTGSGQETTTRHVHVVTLTLPAYLPDLELTPEGLGSRFRKLFGARDIDFESEEFNRCWRVDCAMPRFAHDVIHPRLMHRLLQPDARDLNLRITGTDVLVWTPGRARTATIDARLRLLADVVDSVPRFVWQEHGHDPGPTRS